MTLFDLVDTTAPTDVCYALSRNGETLSAMYDCDEEMTMYYNGSQCEGETWMEVSEDASCDGYDCDYGIIKIYNETAEGDCDSTTYSEVPLSMGCVTFSDYTIDLYCKVPGTNGGKVMADLYFNTNCSMLSGNPLFTNELSSAVGFIDSDANTACIEAKCYQAGHDRTTTTGVPTAAPVPTPAPTDPVDATMKMHVSVLSAVLVMIGLLK